jgi:hypothetical protein
MPFFSLASAGNPATANTSKKTAPPRTSPAFLNNLLLRRRIHPP